jgi:hypothetical protein
MVSAGLDSRIEYESVRRIQITFGFDRAIERPLLVDRAAFQTVETRIRTAPSPLHRADYTPEKFNFLWLEPVRFGRKVIQVLTCTDRR